MRRAKTHILALLLAVMLCCAVAPVSAFADGGTGDGGVLEYWSQTAKPQQTVQLSQPTTEDSGQQSPQQGEPLSQDSQFSTRDLLYDKDTHKQFITVEGRDGNIFYIVIDYDAPTDDKEEQYKTYFLNKVDEADLDALLEEGEPVSCSCSQRCVVGAINATCPLCAVNMSECVGKEPEPVQPVDPEPEPEPERKAPISVDGILTVVLAVALAGAGAVYFLKLRKEKPDVKGSADLDDYDYGDEDSEYDPPEDSFDAEEDE